MTHTFSARLATVSMSLVIALSLGTQFAHAAMLTSTLDFGATGADVTSLQNYLATNGSIYPEGLITGYFGSLTQAAVQRFQNAQGIVTSGTPATTGYGRVGPTTLARINSLMVGGQVSTNGVPVIGTPTVQFGSTGATVTWTTNVPTQGQLYWSTSPIQADEATGPNQQPYISGTLTSDTNGLQTSHSVTISNLQANTTYYYLIRVVNNTGGVTITWPSGSFHTNS